MMLVAILVLALGGPQYTQVVVAPAETLRVAIHGEGPPVVLLPGFFGSAYTYRGVVERLAANGRRTIVIEPLGLGGSSRPRQADYSLTAQADRVAAVLDSLQVTGAVVVAHAIGAGIALRLALRHPALVRSIVSIEGGPAEAAGTAGFRRAMALAPLIRLVGGAGILRGRARATLVRSSGDASWVTDTVMRAYTGHATANIGATMHAFSAMARAREPVLLEPRLRELRCPVLLLIGEAPHEGGLGGREIALLESSLRQFELKLIPGAGLYVQEERPDVVAEAVERQLAAGVRMAGN